MPEVSKVIPDPRDLGRKLYEVLDTIQHDWTRGPIELEPMAKYDLLVMLRGARGEISWLLNRLGAENA